MILRRIFYKVRLCLCLLIGIGGIGCSAINQRQIVSATEKSYRLTIEAMPGYDISNACNAILDSETNPTNKIGLSNIFRGQYTRSFVVKNKNEEQLQAIISELNSLGIVVQEVSLYTN